MARQARIVIPHTPHHIAQRGKDGQFVFFEKSDFQSYLDILKEQCARFEVTITNYCLMPNQIHLLLTPGEEKISMAKAIGETNRQYSAKITKEGKAKGSIFQNRFFSYAADGQTALKAACFMENLPVVSSITTDAENYLWSSARYRIKNITHNFLNPMPSFHAMENWKQYLMRPMPTQEMDAIARHLQTGRPRGNDMFLDQIEEEIGRTVRPKKPGRKPKPKAA